MKKKDFKLNDDDDGGDLFEQMFFFFFFKCFIRGICTTYVVSLRLIWKNKNMEY